MDNTFKNSENSKKSDPHSIGYCLIVWMKQTEKEVTNMLLYQILACTINIKKLYENNKYKFLHGIKI